MASPVHVAGMRPTGTIHARGRSSSRMCVARSREQWLAGCKNSPFAAPFAASSQHRLLCKAPVSHSCTWSSHPIHLMGSIWLAVRGCIRTEKRPKKCAVHMQNSHCTMSWFPSSKAALHGLVTAPQGAVSKWFGQLQSEIRFHVTARLKAYACPERIKHVACGVFFIAFVRSDRWHVNSATFTS